MPLATVLHLEDSDADALLVADRLSKAGVPVAVERATGRTEYEAKLRAGGYDLILSDHRIPAYDGLDALAFAHELHPDTPFLFVSGAMGEEAAVDALKRGATDYVLKDNLARLPAAVGRALAEAGERAARRRLAGEVERQARVFDALLSSITDFAYILDRDARFVYANPPLLALWGLPLGAAVGKDFFALGYPPDLAARLAGQVREVFATRRPLADRTPYTSPTGAGGFYEYILSPVLAADGSVEAVAGTTRDVTGRMRAESALHEAEERFAFVRRSSGVGFWYCDLPFDVLEWDERVKAHFHLPPDAAVTIDTFYERLHPDDRERTRGAIAASIADRTAYRIDYRTVHPHTGEEKWVRATGRTAYAADGAPTRFDGVTIDLTDLMRAEREQAALNDKLREQDRRKDEFLATLAHELRNPLAPIRNGLAVLRRKPADAPRLTDMMERQLAQMVHLVDDLLDVSRVTTGKIKLKPERVDLRELVDAAVETSRPLVESAGHALAVTLPPGPLPLVADRTRITQVLANLLNNAAKYTPAGGRISVSAELGARGAELNAVSDAPPGVHSALRTPHSKSRSPTPAWASRRTCCRWCSTCSPRWARASTARRAGWASG